MTKRYFVTGTDTDVGKTIISCALLKCFSDAGYMTAGMKPVASGCDIAEDGLRNRDAVMLQESSSNNLDYSLINPYAFQPAIAPHIAADQQGVAIDPDLLAENLDTISAKTDVVIVEGAGGWFVPLNQQQTLADFAMNTGLPVILVVGIKLGCINHALLTQQAIANSGLSFVGWVANEIDPRCENREEIIQYLEEALDAPLLGCCPHIAEGSVDEMKSYLSIEPLLTRSGDD